MKKHLFTLVCLILCASSLLLYSISNYYPYWIETYYSMGINHFFIQILSQISGLFPFSLFEISIYLLVAYLTIGILYRLCKMIVAPSQIKVILVKGLLHLVHLGCLLGLTFICFWGLNYNRLPLEHTLQFSKSTASEEKLIQLYDHLIEKANSLRPFINENSEGYVVIEGGYKNVFKRAEKGYTLLSEDYPVFKGTYGTPKPIIASKLMNYTGITGVYSPFTAEANVNISILDQYLPVTTLHEMAHQRGFAQEDECNFIAFLACTKHPDVDFQYSGYLLALAYTNTQLARTNYSALLEANQKLLSSVLLDLKHNNEFWAQYEGPVEKVSSKANDTYLKANGVEDGEASYSRMVDLLISYYNIL